MDQTRSPSLSNQPRHVGHSCVILDIVRNHKHTHQSQAHAPLAGLLSSMFESKVWALLSSRRVRDTSKYGVLPCLRRISAIQSLTTGIRVASYRDAADRLERFEALAVSQIIAWQKRKYQKNYKTGVSEATEQLNKFDLKGFMAQKGLWNLVREKIMKERGALPKEEGDTAREHQAMHEENFLSSSLREDG